MWAAAHPGPALLRARPRQRRAHPLPRRAWPCRHSQHLTATADVTPYTRATFLSEVCQQSEVFSRLCTAVGRLGSADEVRDLRGFALKFSSKDDNDAQAGKDAQVFLAKDLSKVPQPHFWKPQGRADHGADRRPGSHRHAHEHPRPAPTTESAWRPRSRSGAVGPGTAATAPRHTRTPTDSFR
ncbi:catalase [Actinacidiphila oryziradicis]|uniref:Catalase n=1 Tax=Actinacidiphila oryziradicis TaxID=2571141 RepID=A0A4U0R9U3_9ACTN|nr:catalase [Actinacidiphila oryziradicis]